MTFLSHLTQEILNLELIDEAKEISEDFRWSQSKEGKLILRIESWIEEQRKILDEKWPKELIYIGRSFDEPISLIIGGMVNSKIKDEVVLFLILKDLRFQFHTSFK